MGLDAEVIVPAGADVTCHSGSGSVIDYMIISRHLVPYIRSFKVDTLYSIAYRCDLSGPVENLFSRLRHRVSSKQLNFDTQGESFFR